VDVTDNSLGAAVILTLKNCRVFQKVQPGGGDSGDGHGTDIEETS